MYALELLAHAERQEAQNEFVAIIECDDVIPAQNGQRNRMSDFTHAGNESFGLSLGLDTWYRSYESPRKTRAPSLRSQCHRTSLSPHSSTAVCPSTAQIEAEYRRKRNRTDAQPGSDLAQLADEQLECMICCIQILLGRHLVLDRLPNHVLHKPLCGAARTSATAGRCAYKAALTAKSSSKKTPVRSAAPMSTPKKNSCSN